MNCLSTAVDCFRSGRKCFSVSGSLLLAVVMLSLAAPAILGHPSDEPEFNIGDEYTDADNVEFHHVKLVDGVMHENHPIIMYKEDFVNEDYVPPLNASQQRRRYKDIAHHRRRHSNHSDGNSDTEHYRVLKPEIKLFDMLPEVPLTDSDELNLDKVKIEAVLVPLVNSSSEVQVPEAQEAPVSKDILNKRPKKFHHRHRRQVDDAQHNLKKRNPHYRFDETSQNNVQVQPIYVQQYPSYPKHTVPGKLWNALNIVVPSGIHTKLGEEEPSRPIWGTRPLRTTPRPKITTESPRLPSFFHNSDPNFADYSFLTKAPPIDPSTSAPVRQNSRPAQQSTSRSEPVISQCVWAIVTCCSTNSAEIRYSCFEEFGCRGAFWGLNPCAENQRDSIIEYAVQNSR